ncbi:hypothetical protein ACET8U_22770 [Aeromonas veronii]
MRPQPTHPLIDIMRDLALRQHKLEEQIDAFRALQQEIKDLKVKAPHDFAAQQRLERLHTAQKELHPLLEELNEIINRLRENTSFLEGSINKSTYDSPIKKTAKSAPIFGSSFI